MLIILFFRGISMSIKKKALSFLTSAVCIISSVCILGMSDSAENSVKASSLTGQTASEITSQMTIGWNLGNTLDATNDNLTVNSSPKKFVTSWGNPEPTQELFNAVQAGGFNTVRIPTTWYQHLIYNEETDVYEIEENWMNYVKQTVDYAYGLGMFVIINVHHEDWVNVPEFTDETLSAAQHKLRDIWSQVSEEFADYDQHLIFEGMNEPRQTGNSNVSEWGNGSGDNGYSWNYINTLNQTFVETVRSQGSSANNERLLMIPGYVASSDATALNNVTIPENSGNVALSVHAYAPYFFTMATDEYANHEFPGKSGWGEDYEYNLKSLFSSLKSISDSKGVPIIIGEFSASDFDNTSSRETWAKCYLSNAKSVGIPCVLWDNNEIYNGTGEAHGYIYRLTNTWYPNSLSVIAAMMDTLGITNYSLPEYQEYVKPEFSWDNVQIGDDWVELYREENGKNLAAWKNFTVSGWQNYINDNYKLVMFYDAVEAPTIIFQGGWYTVTSNDSLAADFTAGFTYDDVTEVLDAQGVQLADMTNMFISATAKSATIYGLYAVPVSSQPQIDFIPGDVNSDNVVNVFDAVKLRIWLNDPAPKALPPHASAYDVTGDGMIAVADLVLLQQYLVGMDVELTYYKG